MFILYAVVIGVAAGLLVGGSIGGLATVEIRWPRAIVAGLLTQVVLFSGPVAERIGDLGPALYVASTVLVVAAVARNAAMPGIPVVIAGAASNLAAIVANGGFMPASLGALAAAGKDAPTTYSNSSVVPDPALAALTDIFALPRDLPLTNVFSVGDVLIGVGIALTIILAMRRPVPPEVATA